MTVAPMLGRAAARHGSCCGGPPGIDCADYSSTRRIQRKYEKRQWRRQEGLSGRSAGNSEDCDA